MADLGEQLLWPVEGCFFGPAHGLIQHHASAVAEVGVPVRQLSPKEARVRFPAFLFRDDDLILADSTASVVAASRTLEGILSLLERRGVDHPQPKRPPCHLSRTE